MPAVLLLCLHTEVLFLQQLLGLACKSTGLPVLSSFACCKAFHTCTASYNILPKCLQQTQEGVGKTGRVMLQKVPTQVQSESDGLAGPLNTAVGCR